MLVKSSIENFEISSGFCNNKLTVSEVGSVLVANLVSELSNPILLLDALTFLLATFPSYQK
jgi:hypothetical protein